MKILNLSASFEPLGPGMACESFTFPGGEPHIKIKANVENEEVTITHRIRQFNDIGLLLVARNALSLAGAKATNLFLPYFPGARQDRLMVNGEPLTVKVYAELINAQLFNRVTIFDPHSDVAPALINNVHVLSNSGFIQKCSAFLPDFALVAPDAGALKKIYRVADSIKNTSVIECGKVRDTSTGKLSCAKVHADDLAGKSCLIVDDICDGGLTFLGLAKALREKNAGKLYLAVSHGIFSKGLTELSNVFERIFTTDSFYEGNDPKVQTITFAELNKETL